MILNKKFSLLLISLLMSVNFAEATHFGLSAPEDFTGDSIIGAPTKIKETENKEVRVYRTSSEIFADRKSQEEDKGTMAPIKKLRLKYRDKYKRIFTTPTNNPTEFLEPVQEPISVNKLGEVVSLEEPAVDKQEKKTFVQRIKDKKAKKQSENENEKKVSADVKSDKKNPEKTLKVEKTSAKLKDRMVMDCQVMDYDNETAVIKARGNVKIRLPEQGVALYANEVEYDKVANIIRANDKVVIRKGDLEVTGDFIVIDLNEENILLERPISNYNSMEIVAEQANMHEGVISQENGSILFVKSSPLHFRSGKRGPKMERFITKKDDTLSEEIAEGRYKVKVTKMVIDSEKEHDSFLIQKATIYKDGQKKITIPRTKFYTNKNRDYTAGDFFEIGSKRQAGLFMGPGFVFKLPKGAALKAVPYVSYKDEFGYGGLLRFNSGTNETYLMYGSQHDIFIGRGHQELDDNLYLEYGTNDYMNEWFLGRARPKYGAALVYDKSYTKRNFFGRTRDFTFRNKVSGGFYKDIDYDKYYRKLKGRGEETYRFKYMAQGTQTIFNKVDEENLTCLRFDLIGQLSSAVYGTGDTQVVARVGPRLHTQYKNWMQDIGYFQSAFRDDTPMPVFDKYRYGKSNAYIRETIKLHRLLAVSWFLSTTLSDDSYNDKLFQENSFYITIGPEELYLSLGYDFVRENAYFSVAVALDPKGTEVTYDKLEIKNADKLGRKKDDNTPKEKPLYTKPVKQPILRNAIVQEMRT